MASPTVNVILPLLPVADLCLFPQSSLEIPLDTPHVQAALELASRCGNRVFVVAQNGPKPTEIYPVGTVARVLSVSAPESTGVLHADVDGLHRARCISVLGVDVLAAETEEMAEGEAGDAFGAAVEVLARFVHSHQKLRVFLDERRRSEEPMAWVNLVCQHLPIRVATRQQLLEADAAERCHKVGRVLEALLKKEQA